MSAIFSASSTRITFEQNEVFAIADSTPAEKLAATANGVKLSIAFFNRTQEVMGMYLLMLFGLTLSKATKP
jgi:hypothetical protein